MIVLPDNDTATNRWNDFKFSATLLTRCLPPENGMCYALKNILATVQEIEGDEISFQIRDLRPYFAALATRELLVLQDTVRNSTPNLTYIQSAYYGYQYVLLYLESTPYPGDLQHIWRNVARAHSANKNSAYHTYRDVVGYLKRDIETMRHVSVEELRKDILMYMERIRRSTLQKETRQQVFLACCLVLAFFH